MDGYSESKALKKARDYERHMEQYIDQDELPLFHLTPRVGWMNDPNGFSCHGGLYHLFYQYNPYSTIWGPMHWGHAVSRDLLHWEHLPAALAPDEEYDDALGCFSGSAIDLPDGRHLLMYTGVCKYGQNEDGSDRTRQTQCLAVGDGVDYVKYEGNPVITGDSLPEGSSIYDFRDPKIWQDEQGTYHVVLANLAATGGGQIVEYVSDDAFSWRFSHVVATNDDRFGIMWECPDLFELDGSDVLLLSPQDMLAESHKFYSGNGTLYLMGHLDPATGALVEESAEPIDNGIDFYATQTLLSPDGRRIMVAWMQNWDSTSIAAQGRRWFSQMTIPRELSVADGRLYQWPIRELDALRANEVTYKDVRLGDAPVVLDGVEGRVADILIDVRPENEDDPYREFVVWFATDGRYHCSLRYHPLTGTFKISRMHSGSRRAFVHHRKCDVPDATAHLTIRMVLDKGSVEVFINGGVKTMSMAIPTEQSADGISFHSRGASIMNVSKYDLIK